MANKTPSCCPPSPIPPRWAPLKAKFINVFKIQDQNNFRVINLTDGSMLFHARRTILDGMANGINLNFTRNHPETLEPLRGLEGLLSVIVHDYVHSWHYDYSFIHSLSMLRHLAVYTTDRKEIDFSCFPVLESAALFWRPKANSLFNSIGLKRLFLGKYTGKNVSELYALQKLEYLRLNTGSIKTLEGLANLHNIRELMLMQLTKLEDIQELRQLKKIEYLRIDNCRRITNINVVKEMFIPHIEIVGTTPS